MATRFSSSFISARATAQNMAVENQTFLVILHITNKLQDPAFRSSLTQEIPWHGTTLTF